MKNIKKLILDWFKLYSADEVEKIVDFWTVQHKQASSEIDRLNKEFSALIAYDPNRVIKFKDGKILLGDYEISEQELAGLKSEATFLKQSEIWKVMQNTLTELARKNMFENSKDFCGMHAGKATLFDEAAKRQILETIINYQKK